MQHHVLVGRTLRKILVHHAESVLQTSVIEQPMARNIFLDRVN
jgi:hypothetical protein